MRGFCDCCDRGPRELSFTVAYGIDTWACWECTGGEEPEPDDEEEEA